VLVLAIPLALGVALLGTRSVDVNSWSGAPAAAPGAPPNTPAPIATPAPARPVFDALAGAVDSLVSASDAQVAVDLVELGGPDPGTWSTQADDQFTAASTYKLPLLMEEAQLIGSGRASTSDTICYQAGDWEDGWFGDYGDGACYTRGELDERVAHYSDNTAAHMLVRTDGGGDALNAYAAQLGASESAFYDPNVTTASDLARLWQSEAAGRAGGAAAQAYLYPLLTGTEYESGIPAGVPSGVRTVHKVGFIDGVVNDAALVQAAGGPYVLTVCTDGQGGDAGWQLVAAISRAVWSYEARR
jgi:beta-lactamase class A